MYFVDRSSVVLKPTAEFLAWLLSTDDSIDLTLEQIRSNCSVFLVPEFDTPEEIMGYIGERYRSIFVGELSSWIMDESLFPKELTLDLFWAFFDLEIHDMVVDLEDDELSLTHVM